MLNCFLVQAQETNSSELPTLSAADKTEFTHNSSDEELSFFEKVKIFLGFGKKSENDPINSTTKPVAQKDNNNIIENKKITSIIDDSQITDRSFDDSEDSQMSISYPVVFDNQGESENLELPSGFDEINKASEEITLPTTEQPVKIAEETTEELKLPSSETIIDVVIEKPELAPKTAPPPVDNNTLTIPSYTEAVDTSERSKIDISEYNGKLQSKQLKSLDEINSKNSTSSNESIEQFAEVISAPVDGLQLKFINDEAKVLTLPNDDVVLGKLTENAQINLMDFRLYMQRFWANYNQIEREPKRYSIDKFINDYDKNFNQEDKLYHEDELITKLNEAFRAIDNNNINNLISILNNYPILQLTGEKNNTLLHEAAYADNYLAAKLLILKGADIFARNTDNQTALNIAEKFNNQQIIFLLKSAKHK